MLMMGEHVDPESLWALHSGYTLCRADAPYDDGPGRRLTGVVEITQAAVHSALTHHYQLSALAVALEVSCIICSIALLVALLGTPQRPGRIGSRRDQLWLSSPCRKDQETARSVLS